MQTLQTQRAIYAFAIRLKPISLGILETRPADAMEALQFVPGSQVSEGQVKVEETK